MSTVGSGGEKLLEDDFLDELVSANHILSHQGVLDAYGHVSARDPVNPGTYWISRSMPGDDVERDCLIQLTLDGTPVSSNETRLFHERVIHGEIYRARPDVKAIVHCHAPSLIPFCNTTTLLRPMTGPAAFLESGAPTFDSRDVDDEGDLNVVTKAQGRALAHALGSGAIVLLRRHGAVVVGTTMREMVRRAVVADLNARQQLQATTLGEVQFLTESELAYRRKGSRDPDRSWFKWKQQARRAREQ